ncbi:hypothetical protein [Nocardia wallacei]|uniref:hypothetical protein n=1 Tax=Nocardia wallacei TaxID=480035 RepID=UPI0024544847|nr:hypothetical protein [Nocardia wallacei]
MKVPMPPKGVRMVRGDKVIPLELAYDGLRGDGQHVWISATPFRQGVDRIEFDSLPANTSIEFDEGGD